MSARAAEVAIAGIATALPEHAVTQAEVRAFARRRFADLPAIDRLLGAFDNTGIATRRLARPLSWYEQDHDFPAKNAVWHETALALANAATRRALARSGCAAGDVAALVFVSTTGIATPSLDGRLIQDLGLRRSTARVPLWGLGCAGGAAGLARAAELCRGIGRPVVLVAVEVCSATFVPGDRSTSNVIATALFADGAAAVVLVPGADGPQIVGGHTHLLDDSEDVMGWNVRTEGLAVRFARSIPGIVLATMPRFVADAQATIGGAPLRHMIVHPGGAKVLAAYADALDLPPARFASAHAVLRDHGNMSSPTALFVLERFLADNAPTGEHGLVVGLGPGFAAEAAILRW